MISQFFLPLECFVERAFYTKRKYIYTGRVSGAEHLCAVFMVLSLTLSIAEKNKADLHRVFVSWDKTVMNKQWVLYHLDSELQFTEHRNGINLQEVNLKRGGRRGRLSQRILYIIDKWMLGFDPAVPVPTSWCEMK